MLRVGSTDVHRRKYHIQREQVSEPESGMLTRVTRMKFGINFFPAFRPNQKTTAEYFTQCLRVSERADALGFSSVKAVEHYFHDYGGHSPNPIVLLAAIAARTRRLRPITGAVIPAFNHPIKLAGELAMLDNLSQRPARCGVRPRLHSRGIRGLWTRHAGQPGDVRRRHRGDQAAVDRGTRDA